MFKDGKIRNDFHHFIKAKLDKTQTEESLTIREIFNARTLTLPGVASDFLSVFKTRFVHTIASGNFSDSKYFKEDQLTSESAIAAYFDLVKKLPNAPSRGMAPVYEVDDNGLPYEIYYPYSENFPPDQGGDYTITQHPLTNNDSNTGDIIDSDNGTIMEEVMVDDDYVYETPTYIATYEDGLMISDFENGNVPVTTGKYWVQLEDDDYNPVIFQGGAIADNPPSNPAPGECDKRLVVKDGRWTLLNNGYGIFEGKIEFAFAVTAKQPGVTIPNQDPQSNPIVNMGKVSQSWSYKKLRRRTVRRMRDNPDKYVSFGYNVSPWCPGDESKMMFLYEYDKPNFLSSHAKEFSEGFSALVASALIKDKTTRDAVKTFLTAILKATLEGTADSKIEHYSIIGSTEVFTNQQTPSAGTIPTLLNGHRIYGTNDVNVTFVID